MVVLLPSTNNTNQPSKKFHFSYRLQPHPHPCSPQRQSIKRLCGIGCKDYIFISSPSAIPNFPNAIDEMFSSAKISSRTPTGIGLPCVHPGTFSFTALATFLPMLISNCLLDSRNEHQNGIPLLFPQALRRLYSVHAIHLYFTAISKSGRFSRISHFNISRLFLRLDRKSVV